MTHTHWQNKAVRSLPVLKALAMWLWLPALVYSMLYLQMDTWKSMPVAGAQLGAVSANVTVSSIVIVAPLDWVPRQAVGIIGFLATWFYLSVPGFFAWLFLALDELYKFIPWEEIDESGPVPTRGKKSMSLEVKTEALSGSLD